MKYLVIEQKDKRVVLVPTRDVKDTETLLQSIEADSWVAARAKVKESSLYQDYGRGWFKK